MTGLKRYLTSKSLMYPYLYYGCPLWGNNYEAPLSKGVKLQIIAVCIINDVPLMEPILKTCLLFYEYLNNHTISSFSLTFCSEQHTYYTQSALSDQLVVESFRTNPANLSIKRPSIKRWTLLEQYSFIYPAKIFEIRALKLIMLLSTNAHIMW